MLRPREWASARQEAAIVALARKLFVALWNATFGEIIEGAVMKSAA
jgi:hypothetical protein